MQLLSLWQPHYALENPTGGMCVSFALPATHVNERRQGALPKIVQRFRIAVRRQEFKNEQTLVTIGPNDQVQHVNERIHQNLYPELRIVMSILSNNGEGAGRVIAHAVV